MKTISKLSRALIFALWTSGLFLTVVGVTRLIDSTQAVPRWLNYPAMVLTHALLGPHFWQFFTISVREVCISAAAVGLASVVLSLTWTSRRRYWNSFHWLIFMIMMPLACLAFIPGYIVPLWSIRNGMGATLTGEGQLVIGWQTPLSGKEDRREWIRLGKVDQTTFTTNSWYSQIPGVRHEFEVDEFSQLFGLSKKLSLEHKLLIEIWLFLVPGGIYLLFMTFVWLMRSPRIRTCPECRYNWASLTEGFCPGCNRPIDAS